MRLIYTTHDQRHAIALSDFLKNEKIENQFEIVTNDDWGSPDYGSITCRVWVIDEDQVEDAIRIVNEFTLDPNNPRFYNFESKLGTILDPIKTVLEDAPIGTPKLRPKSPIPSKQESITSPITYFIVLICALLLFLGVSTEPHITKIPEGASPVPYVMPPVYKKMLVDYPQAFEVIDKLIKIYGIEKAQDPALLPPEGKMLLKQYFSTPYWQGFYKQVVEHYKNNTPITVNAPLFEKVQDGEFWRLFTPALLHANLLHLLFNMLWVVVLGRQMEAKLGIFKYLLFIVITGVICNVLQYLMSGPDFVGFSGIIFAMLTFVWVRMRHAAWEGYQLQPMTMTFMLIYLFMLIGIEVASFFTETYYNTAISPGIANTGHLSGAISGWILGRTNLFSWKT